MSNDFVHQIAHGPTSRSILKPPRQPHDVELLPSRERMSAVSGRGRGLNLRALTRWLQAHVGQPWNTVHSELVAKVGRGYLGQQILKSALGQVERLVEMRGKEAWVVGGDYVRDPYPVEGLYVHPRTKLLQTQQLRAAQRRSAEEDREQRQQAYRRVLSPTQELHKLNGLWFLVEISQDPYRFSGYLPGPGLYFESKRQLSAKELKQYGLSN